MSTFCEGCGIDMGAGDDKLCTQCHNASLTLATGYTASPARVRPQTQYWTDAVSEACESVGLSVSIHELCSIAAAMETAHENYGQAFYQPPAGEHLTKENRDLRTKLAIEESKVVCPACGGRGIETSNGPVHSSVSTCWKCNGDKKVSP